MSFANKFKKGAASFYIVAFSTLILMIVAISFATVIISEVERTSNDDLSQSAYDSALAGIEDAKLAYYNYQNCLQQDNSGQPSEGSAVSCAEIINYMDESNNDTESVKCDTVWKMLGKNDSEQGRIIEVVNGVNNMSQATTCVTMTDELDDYRGTLSSSNMVDVIKLSFVDGVSANDISSLRLRWFSREDAAKAGGLNLRLSSFPASSVPAVAPPVVSLTVLQTGENFEIDSFSRVNEERTNRGTLYFRPSDSESDKLDINALAKSNSKKSQNNPYRTKCDINTIDEFACTVDIELPKPLGGYRSDETFELIVSLPYGQPSTEFLVQLYCEVGKCGGGGSTMGSGGAAVARTKGVQIEVDSTGKANDLYRRVMTRLKSKSDLALSVMGPLELLDADDGKDSAGMKKDLTVTKEYNFEP